MKKYNARREDLEGALRQACLLATVEVDSEYSTYGYVVTREHRFTIDLRAGKFAASAAAVDMVRRSADGHAGRAPCPYCR